MRGVWVAGVALALAGCAHDRAVGGGETITYTTTRCLGSCPAYTITLEPDGQGIFVGQQFTAVAGESRFRATPKQVRAFTAMLAPLKPIGEHIYGLKNGECEQVGTDAPGVRVRWQGALQSASLSFYYGCIGRKATSYASALRAAPDLLPIADLIGNH